MIDSLLDRALSKATQGNRNETGLWLGCQLRDSGYTGAEAEGVMLDYASGVDRNGTEPYTRAEAGAADYVAHVASGDGEIDNIIKPRNEL